MNDFKQLAEKYLAFNKRRSVLTIFGVSLSAMILFILINSSMSLYMTALKKTREEVTYEASFLCPSKLVKEEFLDEEYIKETRVEEIPEPIPNGEKQYVIYVNFKHPYLMKGYIKDITEKYGMECQLTPLATFYFAEDGGGIMFVLALFVVLIAYVFAIFGVAVVRNSIQLMTLEQIRDYGMLRCMGSTKKQLKQMVFRMGFLLEISGIIMGVALGFLVYLLIAVKAQLEIGFHVISVFLILLAFMFDLYFVMQENCRFVNKLTPVAAVRGEFKIKTDKIKARRKSLAGVLFGIEGDYASKNLKRNPARMWKSVGAMSMGIAMMIIALSLCDALYNYATSDSSQYGKYQLTDVGQWQPGLEQQRNRNMLLPQECVDILNSCKQVTVAKDVHEVFLYTADYTEMFQHYTEEFLNDADYGRLQRSALNGYEKYSEEVFYRKTYEMYFAENSLVGYDESDYANLESALQEGTLDLSDNGILLVNGTCTMVEDTKSLKGIWREFTMTDYKVGDTIEFVDYQKLDAWIKEQLNGKELIKENGSLDYDLARDIFYEGYQEMLNQGATRTYVIEGILKKDTNRTILWSGPRFVLPLERFLEETGLTKEQTAGKMYHIEGHQLDEDLYELLDMMYGLDTVYDQRWYLDTLEMMETIWNVVIGAGGFVMFVVVVNLLNIINTTASDLHLRRKEFAQLRVLGMSKRKLTFTVLLEGLISALLSGVIGVALGYLIVTLVMDGINYALYVKFTFSWGLCAVLVLVSTLILCLTVYLPIKAMKINMAEELLASGE